MPTKSKVIVINEKDNVATAIMELKAGETVLIPIQGRLEKVELHSHAPMGHKFALRAIAAAEDVIKYGEPIGRSTSQIARGEHVHVHNVASHRGRKEGV
jgi:altronate dehydratase small subunit